MSTTAKKTAKAIKPKPKKKTKAASNILYGLAGEYAVCAELCRRGILALPTPKNNPLFDVAAMHPATLRSVAIQVKTMSPENKQGWNLGAFNAPDPLPDNLFLVLVRLKATGPTDYYVWDYAAFHKRVDAVFDGYMKKPRKDGDPHKDPGMRWFDLKDFVADDEKLKDACNLLGFPANQTK